MDPCDGNTLNLWQFSGPEDKVPGSREGGVHSHKPGIRRVRAHHEHLWHVPHVLTGRLPDDKDGCRRGCNQLHNVGMDEVSIFVCWVRDKPLTGELTSLPSQEQDGRQEEARHGMGGCGSRNRLPHEGHADGGAPRVDGKEL